MRDLNTQNFEYIESVESTRPDSDVYALYVVKESVSEYGQKLNHIVLVPRNISAVEDALNSTKLYGERAGAALERVTLTDGGGNRFKALVMRSATKDIAINYMQSLGLMGVPAEHIKAQRAR